MKKWREETKIPKWGDMLSKAVAALKKGDCDPVTNYALKKC